MNICLSIKEYWILAASVIVISAKLLDIYFKVMVLPQSLQLSKPEGPGTSFLFRGRSRKENHYVLIGVLGPLFVRTVQG